MLATLLCESWSRGFLLMTSRTTGQALQACVRQPAGVALLMHSSGVLDYSGLAADSCVHI